jgi:hypothetical protein
MLSSSMTRMSVFGVPQIGFNYTALFGNLQIYNTALTAAQLTGMWASQAAPSCSSAAAAGTPPPAGSEPPAAGSPPSSLETFPAGTVLRVTSTASMGGMAAADFGTAEQELFAATLATTLQVSGASVTVTGVADTPTSTGRRRLLEASVDVAFSVTSNSTTLFANVTALSANATAFATALQAAGLPITGVAVAVPTQSAAGFASTEASTTHYNDLALSISTMPAAQAAAATATGLAELTQVNNTTPEALAATANSVSQLLNATQINPANAQSALSILLSVSSAGSERGVPVTLAAATSVAASLSSIVGAVALGGALNASVFAQVFNVVNSLANSQLSGLSVGAPAVEINSPAIQARACASSGLCVDAKQVGS